MENNDSTYNSAELNTDQPLHVHHIKMEISKRISKRTDSFSAASILTSESTYNAPTQPTVNEYKDDLNNKYRRPTNKALIFSDGLKDYIGDYIRLDEINRCVGQVSLKSAKIFEIAQIQEENYESLNEKNQF